MKLTGSILPKLQSFGIGAMVISELAVGVADSEPYASCQSSEVVTDSTTYPRIRLLRGLYIGLSRNRVSASQTLPPTSSSLQAEMAE
ncbi:hypothetical protein CMI37_11535 [Candidatus Pacearchaeota archaeon]|nr:hypothetical protein [Candidatus Pacearchaeota archaeon]